MKKSSLSTSALMIIIMAVLPGCTPSPESSEADSSGATETAVALDELAASTIEALQDQDVIATSAAMTAQPTPTEQPPTVTLTATPSPTLEFVEVEVDVNTNCRTGPNIAFDYVGALVVGERTRVVARTDVPGYFVVNNPDRPGSTCWLWDRHATIYGDPTRLPMAESPPTPTPAPASLAGWVFTDVNSNGKHDESEEDDGIGGVELVLLVGACPGGAVGYSTQSDSSGRYRFPAVLATSYCLTAEPSGSSLHPAQYSITLNSGDTRDGFNFWRTP